MKRPILLKQAYTVMLALVGTISVRFRKCITLIVVVVGRYIFLTPVMMVASNKARYLYRFTRRMPKEYTY